MTWEELKEKAKEMGAFVLDEQILFMNLECWKNGEVWCFDDFARTITLARNRTPEQMLMIMRGLE